jgi:hypothetical protein
VASVKRFFIVEIIAIFEIDVDRIGVSLHESNLRCPAECQAIGTGFNIP